MQLAESEDIQNLSVEKSPVPPPEISLVNKYESSITTKLLLALPSKAFGLFSHHPS